jgi:Na+-transporting methylmalonyl-CoA/oxaloacetate decarboxylase beta subunit
MVALRPERAFVAPRAAGAPADWTIGSISVVPIVDPCILRDLYAHRGRRVVGRKIRQMRRRFRRNFDPTYVRHTP